MNNRTKRIISAVFVTMLILLSSMFFTSCTSNVELKNFWANETCFIAGKESSIVFTVETENVKSIDLYSDNKGIVGKMQDDGTAGDEVANDGVYTCVISTTVHKASTVKYYAQYNRSISEKIRISYFEQPSEKFKEEYSNIQTEIESMESAYLDNNGYVHEEEIPEVLKKVEEYAKELQDEGKAISYEVTESSVAIKLSSGLTSVYAPEIEGTYNNNSDEMTISIYQPYYDWVSTIEDNYINLPEGISNEADLLMSAAVSIKNTFNNYDYSTETIYLNDEVTIDTIKNLGENQIILWQGHGVFGGEKLHSLVCTGSEFDWEAWLYNPQYYLDCCQDRIVEWGGDEAFSSKFIEKYCQSLDNSFIYLGPCQSGYDNVLANAFLSKGASAVIANTDTILCLYGDMIEYTTTFFMTQINPETQDYYNLSEALNKAKLLYGESDAQYGGDGAIPIIFGGKSAEQFQLGDYIPIDVQDFNIPDNQIITVGELSVIEPVLFPEDADNYTIAWTSSDESVATVTSTGENGIIRAKMKGETIITATLESGGKTITKSTNLRVASQGRDTVLVLDISGSMSGTPMTEMKEAAIDFCQELLEDEYNNRVGLVFYDDEIYSTDLTNDLNGLINRIEDVDDGGTTNMEEAISTAKIMLDSQGTQDSIKNIVVMADGLPNEGKTSDSGSMQTSLTLYGRSISYANAVIDTAQEAMKTYNMYSLGFFHDLSGDSLTFATELMKQLTNQEGGYHQVEDAENLQFAFGDISEEISDGSKVIINIACPVNVTITYNGETISSAKESFNANTSFGSLQLLGSAQDIKVLSLQPGMEYDVQLNGTDVGEMNYSVNYLDENENVTDSREFVAVPITSTTIITSNTNNTIENMDLNIDENGDGEIDIIWSAKKNESGEITYDATTEPIEEVIEEESIKVPEEPVKETSLEAWKVALIVSAVISVCGLMVVLIVVLGKKEKRLEEVVFEEDVPGDQSEDVKLQSESRTEDKDFIGKSAIIILSGPLAGAEIPLRDQEVIYIGKDAQKANVVFSGDFPNVSRLHCSISYEEKYKKYFVTDFSKNGTFFASTKERLAKGKRTPVCTSTILVLGNDKATIQLK